MTAGEQWSARNEGGVHRGGQVDEDSRTKTVESVPKILSTPRMDKDGELVQKLEGEGKKQSTDYPGFCIQDPFSDQIWAGERLK